ncbi:MAG TPA: hypothetical protein VIX42_11345 [Edaphobacter sp.]
MPPIPTTPNPQTSSLFIPWLAVFIIFSISLIIAITTMLYGMAHVGIQKTNLPWWYHTLILLSGSGLVLSALGILALVVTSIRRATRTE